MVGIPQKFKRTTAELHGEMGIQWLEKLPELLADCARRWSLRILPPFELSYNYVAPAVQGESAPVVLKAGFVNPELLTEISALKAYDGRGIVRMLEADAVLGVMLLERLQPGKTLVELGDDREATGIAIAVMRQLWQPAPERHPFPTVAKWAAGMGRMRVYFDGGTGPFPRRLVELAESLFAELIPSMEAAVLLHGDLHHGNILSAQRHPWLALDPKGVVGEPAYEVGAFLRNPSPQPRRIQAWRVDQFSAELGLDRERVIGWGVAQAVLSAWWSIEDHGHGWEPAIETATVLSELLR